MHLIAKKIRFWPTSLTVLITTQDGNELKFSGQDNYGKLRAVMASRDDIPALSVALLDSSQKTVEIQIDAGTVNENA